MFHACLSGSEESSLRPATFNSNIREPFEPKIECSSYFKQAKLLRISTLIVLDFLTLSGVRYRAILLPSFVRVILALFKSYWENNGLLHSMQRLCTASFEYCLPHAVQTKWIRVDAII